MQSFMDHKQRVQASFDKQQFMEHLGAELKLVEPGFCEIHLTFSEKLTQQNGYFHAGAIGMIADTAGGYAAYSLMEPEDSVLTIEYKLNLLAPAKGEKLVVRSRVLRAGRTITVCSSEAYAVDGETEKLCATATVTLMTLKNYTSK